MQRLRTGLSPGILLRHFPGLKREAGREGGREGQGKDIFAALPTGFGKSITYNKLMTLFMDI